MKPLIYGYMQVDPDIPDNHIRQVELLLEDYAEAEGYCFATIFHEDASVNNRSAFVELINELKRSEAHHVIVPSIDHFSSHPVVRVHMLMRLEDETDVQVHTLSDREPGGAEDTQPDHRELHPDQAHRRVAAGDTFLPGARRRRCPSPPRWRLDVERLDVVAGRSFSLWAAPGSVVVAR